MSKSSTVTHLPKTNRTTTIQFGVERETKGTYVFQELDSQGRMRPQYGDPETVIGRLYIRKHIFDKRPQIVTVTIDHSNILNP